MTVTTSGSPGAPSTTSPRDDRTTRYRRAADFVAAAMIYLRDNVVLREPLRPEHLKPRLLGHWGTCPGITYVYSGLNGLVRRTGQRTLFVVGPGHGAPAVHANLWLEGTHADHDPALSRDAAGLAELVRRFSWPGGFPSHLSPQVPGVIHEGGELGYALATAFGAALDDPDLMVACLVGDGEAETGPTAGSWHCPKFLDPVRCGSVLPVLHLNGYKISSPTIYGTMDDEELSDYFRGAGWSPHIVDVTALRDLSTSDTGGADGADAEAGARADRLLAESLDAAHAEITALRQRCREGDWPGRPVWPMLVVRSPKGWGAPERDSRGVPLAGTFHAHQVPLPDVATDPDQLALLEEWLRSYRPEELFDEDGRPAPDLLEVPPEGDLRLGSVPQANGGRLRRDLPLPPLRPHAVDVPSPGAAEAGATTTLANWLTDLMRATEDRRDFRIVCPDELESNKLGAVLSTTGRAYTWPVPGYSEHLATDGRVMEVLSEHLCQGFLQGYLLTGRHGLFPCYEAFVSIVDGMVNQYAKFLKMAGEVAWRAPVASLNYLLTSEGWRQEHNGYSHQGPGFINSMLNKKASVSRIYLPPDANTLLVVMRHCLGTTNRINVVVAGKQPAQQWLDLDAAEAHCRAGAGVWEWACNDGGRPRDPERPDVVLACAGNIPTVEVLGAAWLLRRHAPELRVRVVNVVDLLVLPPPRRHPHGMDETEFAACFGDDAPVVFGFHGYPSAVHELLHGRADPNRFHVHGYLEEGTTTTPYDLLASNRMTRHDLAAAAVSRARGWASRGGAVAEALREERDDILRRAHRDGEDPEEITGWRWTS
ncbi:xylulose-5-phosphate/fructose-6-phosphate phosphoketolase [Streptoalloteichus tenebrarius]|uniref:Xylulose-5-phosphate/fructose-6-phosphate phosphoketolase n=1 Tax=Streptoalloteichus tenebrarius (strain ATCC 17920 / DSM 40477 / JCM 4838 / CBS 697.72 / NBRC 16177 / NCIMB 11028 / NRRL B-12390 / A12253. 1 / ISP 5477) TaxID=1933 RepID=A0ABT1I227_STRSD|nr:phosphoketolase family protein [Streptoalloteichus tenebrarius]MCP2261840.1 xylulose-5-phosphate/fructose-6-phosphate phosphoketolase [Streptoalloteichus tenebrarius]BFE99985.1 phosphoketolase family protein [Streptoalloteichus tenebrarius]